MCWGSFFQILRLGFGFDAEPLESMIVPAQPAADASLEVVDGSSEPELHYVRAAEKKEVLSFFGAYQEQAESKQT